MDIHLKRAGVISVAVAGGMLGTAALAQASDASIAAIYKKDVPSILRSQAKIEDGIATYDKSHTVAPLVRAIAAQNRNLTALEKKLDGQSGSTADGMQAKKDLVTGLRLIIASNTTTVKEVKLGKHASKATLKLAVKEALKGNVDLAAASKLLARSLSTTTTSTTTPSTTTTTPSTTTTTPSTTTTTSTT